MFDTIILLSGEAERRALPFALFGHNPNLTVKPVQTLADLDALDSHFLARARLVSFVTPVIVPGDVLHRLGYGAFNFHPGPPEYPGWAPSHFALYHRETMFGATAHVMVERVDAGPIVGVERFAIPPNMTVLALEGLAYAHLARLFWSMAEQLACDPAPPQALAIPWGAKKYSRRAYRELCDIPPDIQKDDLDRRLKVFGGGHFGVAPAIRLHGVEFRAVLPPDQQATALPKSA
jgi:methionyl-tRNA formyltransferase